MRQIKLSVKKVANLLVVLCLLLSVTGVTAVPSFQESEFEKSCRLFNKHLDTDTDAGEERESESNEACDFFTQPDYAQFAPVFLNEKNGFLYTITVKVNNYIGINTPPPER